MSAEGYTRGTESIYFCLHQEFIINNILLYSIVSF